MTTLDSSIKAIETEIISTAEKIRTIRARYLDNSGVRLHYETEIAPLQKMLDGLLLTLIELNKISYCETKIIN